MDFKVDNLGIYLKEKRKKKKLILNEVATMLDLSAGYISRIERGTSTPSREVLTKLCYIYEIPLTDLIDDDGEINLENIKVGTDLLTLINSRDVTYKGLPINAQDRLNISEIVGALLEIKNLEDKNNFMNVIKSLNNIINKTN